MMLLFRNEVQVAPSFLDNVVNSCITPAPMQVVGLFVCNTKVFMICASKHCEFYAKINNSQPVCISQYFMTLHHDQM